jgi:hypothetical protein
MTGTPHLKKTSRQLNYGKTGISGLGLNVCVITRTRLPYRNPGTTCNGMRARVCMFKALLPQWLFATALCINGQKHVTTHMAVINDTRSRLGLGYNC